MAEALWVDSLAARKGDTQPASSCCRVGCEKLVAQIGVGQQPVAGLHHWSAGGQEVGDGEEVLVLAGLLDAVEAPAPAAAAQAENLVDNGVEHGGQVLHGTFGQQDRQLIAALVERGRIQGILHTSQTVVKFDRSGRDGDFYIEAGGVAGGRPGRRAQQLGCTAAQAAPQALDTQPWR